MPYPTPVDVFEHGIEVTEGDPPAGLARVATTREPVYSGYTITIVDRDGLSLNRRVNHLAKPGDPYRTSDLWDEHDVRYCLRSALYRLDRIIEMYVGKCRLFEEHHSDAISGNTSDPRIYFEVEAFLGDSRRVYDSISKVLWKHYVGRPKGRWRSIRTLVESETNLTIMPPDFATTLKQSWEAFGVKLVAYRDFVMHVGPLAGEGSTWMNRYDGRWGATVGLPTNPESKSRAAFDNVQGNGIDALGYCHAIAAHLARLCEELMALPAVASHIANPLPLTQSPA